MPYRRGAAHSLRVQLGWSRRLQGVFQRLPDRLISGRMRRTPIRLLSVREPVLEHRFQRGQFFNYSVGLDRIDEGGLRAL